MILNLNLKEFLMHFKPLVRVSIPPKNMRKPTDQWHEVDLRYFFSNIFKKDNFGEKDYAWQLK